MKKILLLLFGFLFISGYASAQLLDNFNTAGSLGIFKDAAWGTLTDSIYQTADPTGKSSGVMGVAFDLKGKGDKNAIRPVTQQLVNPKGAQQLTYWVYIPSNSNIPDSLVFGLWWQVNGNWAWNEYDYYAKDIPRGVWYPLSAAILDSSIADPVNDGFNGGKNIFGDFGIQWSNYKDSTVVWKGNVYIDNVSLEGAAPTNYANFSSGIQGFSLPWLNGWVDTVVYADTTVGDSAGVLKWKLINGSASTGGAAMGMIPSPAYNAANQNFIVFWVYVDASFPDTAYIQTWAQDNNKYNWPGPRGIATYNGNNIPRNVWFPVYFDLFQASIADTASSSSFSSTKYKIAKFGLQVGGTTTWSGSVYVRSVQFIDSVVAGNPTAVLRNNNLVKVFKLYNNYPNPFNPSTIISYDLPGELNVTLKVYDILGREVATLVNNQHQAAGSYSVSFNASKLASGVYIYKITAGSNVKSYKMMLLK
jgi:hypothetical protein